MMRMMTQRKRSKLLKQLKEAIYAYYESSTQEDAEIVAQLKDVCILHCGRYTTTNTISKAFWVIEHQ